MVGSQWDMAFPVGFHWDPYMALLPGPLVILEQGPHRAQNQLLRVRCSYKKDSTLITRGVIKTPVLGWVSEIKVRSNPQDTTVLSWFHDRPSLVKAWSSPLLLPEAKASK